MRSFDWIVDEYRVRKDARGRLIEHMRESKDHFNGDVAIPLPEMEKDEKPAVANLMAQGLDQTAMRIASVLPSLEFPPLIPGKDKDQGSEDWARRRKMAVNGWWQESNLSLVLRKSARHLVGYGTASLFVRPNFITRMPEYVLRDPLSSYPSLDRDWGVAQPLDCIYAYKQTFGWLEVNHPEAAEGVRRSYRSKVPHSAVIELLEYISAEERVLGVLSIMPATMTNRIWTPVSESDWSRARGTEITRADNLSGVPWCVQPNRITIDRLQGQFDQVFGIYQNQARLMALETIAVEKAIFPDIVIQGTTAGRLPMLANGQWRDGRSGEVNIIRDGRVEALQLNPGFMTQPLIDRHERNIRQAGVPANFSGEAPTGIATGRMGSQVLSASVDFPIQEYQEVIASSLQQANKAAIAIAKAYFGGEKKTFHVSFNRSKGQADYRPDTHFETDNHFVRYSAPGADVNSLVIGIGQRIGIGTMSKWTAMQQDPMIPDPDFEYRKVTSERVQQALLEFVAQAVASGGLDPQDVVILWEEVERGSNIADAWRKAQEASQKRQQAQMEEQAQAQQAAAEQGMDPSMQAAMQPGLSPAPPGGGEDAGLSIAGPNPNQQNLAMLLGSLRQPRAITAPMTSGSGTPPQVPVG